MKSSANSERNPAPFLFVYVIVTLVCIVGFVGLAIDGGSIYGHPRPQNAADTAALAAALCRIHDRAPIPCAYEMAAGFGYDNDLVSNQVEVYTCDMPQASCGPYAGNTDNIQVIIMAYREMSFTKLVGIRQVSLSRLSRLPNSLIRSAWCIHTATAERDVAGCSLSHRGFSLSLSPTDSYFSSSSAR